MKNIEETHDFDNYFKSISKKINLTGEEQNEMFHKLNRRMNASFPKKRFLYKYYLTSFVALLLFVPVCVYFFLDSNELSNSNQLANQTSQGTPVTTELSIPVLEEMDLTLLKVSALSWNIVNSDGVLVGSVSGVSNKEYEERNNIESIFETWELDYSYPTTFIRQHVKMNNIIQTLYFYMEVNEQYSTPYILLQIHTGQIDDEDAFRIAKSLQIDER